MCRTRFTLDDLGGALSWRALLRFVAHLGRDSALWREVNDPDGRLAGLWDGTWQAAATADLVDAVVTLDFHVLGMLGSRPQRPKPYPRPWLRPAERRVGSGAIPVHDFDTWWDSKVKGG